MATVFFGLTTLTVVVGLVRLFATRRRRLHNMTVLAGRGQVPDVLKTLEEVGPRRLHRRDQSTNHLSQPVGWIGQPVSHTIYVLSAVGCSPSFGPCGGGKPRVCPSQGQGLRE
jgi:hypothetical protein